MSAIASPAGSDRPRGGQVTAGRVMAIWGVAQGQLQSMLSNALGSVK